MRRAIRAELAEPAQPEDEITAERPVVGAKRDEAAQNAPTRRLPAVDAYLLALARNDTPTEPPPDPFGGLIPIYDDDSDLDAGWDGPGYEALGRSAVPRLRMQPRDIVDLPVSDRHGFVLCQIDGQRTLDDIIDICQLADEDVLEMIGELVELGAIDLGG